LAKRPFVHAAVSAYKYAMDALEKNTGVDFEKVHKLAEIAP